jgi:hypothetical protein
MCVAHPHTNTPHTLYDVCHNLATRKATPPTHPPRKIPTHHIVVDTMSLSFVHPCRAHTTALCRYYENVEKILTWPTTLVDGARKGGSGRTALHIAARKGYLRILDMLLAKGADPFVKDKAGKMPLDYATAQRFGKVMEKLRAAMLKRGGIEPNDESSTAAGSDDANEDTSTTGDAATASGLLAREQSDGATSIGTALTSDLDTSVEAYPGPSQGIAPEPTDYESPMP